jgi:hypothetical protein
VYIDTGSPVPNIPSKSRGLAHENKTFWRNGNDSKQAYCNSIQKFLLNNHGGYRQCRMNVEEVIRSYME